MLNSELGILLGILFTMFLRYVFYMMFPFKLCF